jgi:uncharacterized protein (DUF2344 family)
MSITMAEANVNNGAAPVASGEAPTHTVTVDHGTPSSDGSTPNSVKGSNHERLEKAYAQATGGQKLTNEISVETLKDVNGIPEGEFKGVDYNKTINELPEDAKKILANLRSDYTRKTQEIARQQKELEAQRQALLESDAYRSIQAKATEAPVDADPWDPQAFNQRIEQEVAKRLADVLKPMQQEFEVQQRRQKLEKFKSDNPDLEAYKTEIVEVLKTNDNLTLEQAYYMVKGKNQTETLKRAEQELSAYKTAAKDYGLKVSVGSANTGPLKPPASVKRDAYSVYRWLQANQKA